MLVRVRGNLKLIIMETEKCVLFLKFEICELSRAIEWSLGFPVEELSYFLNRHLKIIIY